MELATVWVGSTHEMDGMDGYRNMIIQPDSAEKCTKLDSFSGDFVFSL